MLSDSLITSFDSNRPGKESGDKEPECLFWTGREGQICVQYFCAAGEVFYQPHTHSEYTITVCLAGEVSIKQLGREQVAGPGAVLISNHGVEHSCRHRGSNAEGCVAVSIAVDRRLLADLTRDFSLPPADGAVCPIFLGTVHGVTLRDCAQAIAHEMRSTQAGHKVLIETQALRLVVETIRAWPASGIGQTSADLSQRLPRHDFVRAYEFMRWCRKESFRLRHLCRFLGTSEERFTRLFLASTRHTPASFYNRLLLERARDLLRNPKLSIKEVGFELGYKTSSHFIVAFRREYGVSPQEYRQPASVRETAAEPVLPKAARGPAHLDRVEWRAGYGWRPPALADVHCPLPSSR